MGTTLELRLPPPLAEHLVEAGVASPAADRGDGERVRSGVNTALVAATGVTTTVITILQGPATVTELVRLMRMWRRAHGGDDRLELTVSIDETRRDVRLVAPRNSDLTELARLLHEALGS